MLDGSQNVEEIEIEIGQVDTIDQEAFINCKKLKRVSIQTGTVTIWDRAFSGCSALEKVEIGANVKAIKARAFQDRAKCICKLSGIKASCDAGGFADDWNRVFWKGCLVFNFF